MSGIMRNEGLVSSSNQWYYCYNERGIQYSIERSCLGNAPFREHFSKCLCRADARHTDVWYVLCVVLEACSSCISWTLSKHPQTSSFKVVSLSDEHSLLKKFSEFQKRGKERHINLSYLGKTHPFKTSSNPLRSKWQVYRTNIRF